MASRPSSAELQYTERRAPSPALIHPFLRLPAEVIVYILSFLKPEEVARFSMVSSISDDASLWRSIITRKWKVYRDDSELRLLHVSLLKEMYRMRMKTMVWDPRHKSTGVTIEAGRVAICNNNSWNTVRTNFPITFGRWLWEIRLKGKHRPTLGIGIVSPEFKVWRNTAGTSAAGWILADTGKIWHASQARRVCDPLTDSDVIGVFVDMRARVLGFYRNKQYLVSVQGLPAVVYPCVSLSGAVSATLDFCTEGYVFPSLPSVDADPDAGLFTLEYTLSSDFCL